MFRNCGIAALRYFANNKLHAAINIVGLAIGLTVALLIALLVRDTFAYDRFIPGVERTYNIYTTFEQAGREPLVVDTATAASSFAQSLALSFTSIESIARLAPDTVQLKRGDFQANERVYWADPAIFAVLPLPVISGDLAEALSRADSVVLTRRMARKYFGTDLPVGQTILVAGHPMRVDAVLKDFPSNTSLRNEVFISAKASFSVMARLDRNEQQNGANLITHILLRLKPDNSVAAIQDALPEFVKTHMQQKAGQRFSFQLIPFSSVHLTRSELPAFNNPDDKATILGMGAIGVIILLAAAINFVNLTVARAARRGVEVGIRKVEGATPRQLFMQFIGETAFHVVLALIVAMVLLRLCYPVFGALLQRSSDWSSVNAVSLAELVLGFGITLSLLAGAYPASVLSSFRPISVLQGDILSETRPGIGRLLMVAAQFAVLIGLILATIIIVRQTLYAMKESVRVDTAGVNLITTNDCRKAFLDELEKVSGVTGSSCSSMFALNIGQAQANMVTSNGTRAGIYAIPTDEKFLDFYGVKPVAGRLFSREYGEDISADTTVGQSLILNERAVRQLGYTRPADAIGQTVQWAPNGSGSKSFTIVGIVKDFAFNAVRQPPNPSGYYVDLNATQLINVRVSPNASREALADIDRAWQRPNPNQPISRAPLTQYLLYFYGDVIRLGIVLVLCAVIAVVIACLGLFSLASFIAESRTKEIGIRKTMGASRGDILRLLLWQFMQPVLWAILIASPIVGYLMTGWLQGFVYHITLAPWMFLASSGLALCIAIGTVLLHALRVARTKPVMALRYQ